ncbi:MAG: hypothetical protein N2606_00785 [Candidatus Omnitrophica bacterium]|nr:hypothetical protein [Candidatus Omnitrophota bacterium]
MNKKGVVLFFVLVTILVVVLIANILLNFITSQSSISTHQVKRTQAIYASQAAINFALEQLRLNNANWLPTSSSRQITQRICGPSAPSTVSCVFRENDFPANIQYVEITLTFNSADNITVSATTVYN